MDIILTFLSLRELFTPYYLHLKGLFCLLSFLRLQVHPFIMFGDILCQHICDPDFAFFFVFKLPCESVGEACFGERVMSAI